MGVYREVVAVCDLCSKKERFDDTKSVNDAVAVAPSKGWVIKKKGTAINFVVCPKCRSEIV